MSYIQSFDNLIQLFEWNHAKDRTNRRKHGIRFALARKVFQDPKRPVFIR
jgi:uncharacterized DUF497 family protein